MPTNSLRFASILLVALLAGVSFAHVLELSAKMQYDAALYITLQKSLYVQWGPSHVGGVLEPLTIIVTGLVTFFVRKSKRTLLFSLGALFTLLMAFPVVFFWLVAPANAGFLAATLSAIPANWTELRSSWEMSHAIRFALPFAAFALLVLSLALDANTTPDGLRSQTLC